MKKINRKTFISRSAMGFAGTLAAAQLPSMLWAQAAKTLDIPIGFQSYAVKDMLGKDFAGTLKTMAGLGYSLIEMCSPAGYVNSGFGFLTSMKTADIKSTITDAGLSCPSCHFGFGELTGKLDDRIQFARDLGLSHMICSSFGLVKEAVLKDYLEAADKLNKAAEKIKQAGMQAGYHNHETEFTMLEGKLIYDELMSRFNPDLVKMQFQTEVIKLGYKGSTYFTKYPGRFISAHLSDWTADKTQVPVGKGLIDWKEFFATAKTGGVKTHFVEMKFETFKDSAAYIKGI